MKIKNKILTIFSVATFLVVVLGSSLLFLFSNNALKDLIFSRLETEAQTKSGFVLSFVDEQKEEVISLSKDHHISDFSTEHKKQETGVGESLWDTLAPGVRLYDHSLEALRSIVYNKDEEVFIADDQGEIILSTKEENVDKDISSQDCYLKGKEGLYIKDAYIFEETGVLSMSVSVPAYDVESGKFLGVLTKRFSVEKLNDILKEDNTVSETGESYLLNKEMVMITQSRFLDDVVLKQRVETINSENCLSMVQVSKEDGVVPAIKLHETSHKNIDTFLSYWGEGVLGTHVSIPEMDWCLIAEISEAEVFEPLNKLVFVFLGIVLLMSLMVILISNFIGNIISKPIEELRRGVEIVESGDLNYIVGTKRNDEIGHLSRAFDRMTSALKGGRKEVERKVEKQTEDIISTQKDLEDQRIALLNVLEDVQEEKDIVSSEKDKSETILNSIGDGVMVIDRDFKITVFNEEASEITGYSKTEAVGKQYTDIFNVINEKTQKPDIKFVKKTLTSGKKQYMAELALLKRKDGSDLPVADSSAPIKDEKGNVVGVVIVFRDVTHSRKVEKMRTEFVSVASHQLRTPLTGIQWVVERLLKVSKSLPKEEREYIKDVYFSSKRLSRLVDDLLNVSRVEEGRFLIKMEEVDVVKTIKNYIIEAGPLIAKRKVKVVFKKHPKEAFVLADRNAVQNIVQSVISNAIEYTTDKAEVVVGLEKKDKSIVISVKDNGIGIPKEDQADIFDKFKRGANAQAVKTDGTGLGLYLTQKITQMLGGKIWFKSKENEGTEFFIELLNKSKALSSSGSNAKKV